MIRKWMDKNRRRIIKEDTSSLITLAKKNNLIQAQGGTWWALYKYTWKEYLKIEDYSDSHPKYESGE